MKVVVAFETKESKMTHSKNDCTHGRLSCTSCNGPFDYSNRTDENIRLSKLKDAADSKARSAAYNSAECSQMLFHAADVLGHIAAGNVPADSAAEAAADLRKLIVKLLEKVGAKS